MIKDFANGCATRKNADEIERKCEEVLAAITHEPSTAKQIAERGNIMRIDYRYIVGEISVPNYQRVASEAKILIALGLVKKITEEWEEEVEIPGREESVMIADKVIGNKVLSYHWEWIEAPACKQTFKRYRTLYVLAD